jgi:hypothetical protein
VSAYGIVWRAVSEPHLLREKQVLGRYRDSGCQSWFRRFSGIRGELALSQGVSAEVLRGIR